MRRFWVEGDHVPSALAMDEFWRREGVAGRVDWYLGVDGLGDDGDSGRRKGEARDDGEVSLLPWNDMVLFLDVLREGCFAGSGVKLSGCRS